MDWRMTPEMYEAPAGLPVALSLLALGFVLMAVMFLRAPTSSHRRPSFLALVAAIISFAAILWAFFVFPRVLRWAPPAVPAGAIIQAAIWTPIVLLAVSFVCAALSREIRSRLVPWGLVTLPALSLMLWMFCFAGVSWFDG